jgi:DNA-directed RNA polymerase subunit alpha
MEFKSLYLPDIISWDEESSTDRYGRLVISPLERGFGRTLGNALRRVMLSSLEGAAPVSVRIKGVSHEFSTIPGVIQDVPDIILNIKLLNIRFDGEETGQLRLKAGEPGVVTGADLKGTEEISITNPDQVIAELSEKADLEIEVSVERGKGYMTSDEWREAGRGSEPGTILLDSWFGPVRKVNYHVDSARVGDKTDFDKLQLEIATDGSITPLEAVETSCEILMRHFRMILEGEVEAEEEAEESASEAEDTFEDMNLKDTDLSPRLVNCMAAGGINTLSELASRTRNDLLSLRNFGQASLKTVETVLEGYGLSIRTEEE